MCWKSKRKILISMLAVLFVLVAIVATIAIVFALTQQTIKSSLKINYVAKDVSATIRAEVIYADGTVANMVTDNGQATSITFNAEDTEDTVYPNGTNLSPANDIELTNNNNYVYLKYYFQNNGINSFIVTFDYEDVNADDENIGLSNKIAENEYSETKFYPTLVNGGEEVNCTLKIAIKDLSQDGEFSGDLTCTLDSNIVVATPDTAQALLDAGVNNTTIVFDEGTYGDLVFRPTKETVGKVYHYNAHASTVGTEVTDLNTISSDVSSKISEDINYLYTRKLENVKLLGTLGAKFKGVVTVESSDFGRYFAVTPSRGGVTTDNAIVKDYFTANGITANDYVKEYLTNMGITDLTNEEQLNTLVGLSRYDYIREVPVIYVGSNHYGEGFVSLTDIDGFTAEYMDFEGVNGRIHIDANIDIGATYKPELNNITVRNCSFYTTEPAFHKETADGMLGWAAVIVASDSALDHNATTIKRIENVVIENNYQTGHFQGYYVCNVNGVTIDNNVSLNTYHNGIAVQCANGVTSTGDIIIVNNRVENSGYNNGTTTADRAIRLNAFTDANILIEDNVFVNAAEGEAGDDADDQLLKTGTLTNTTYNFINNTFNGNAIADVVDGNGSGLTIYVRK